MGRPLALLSFLVPLGCASSADREMVHKRNEEYTPVRAALVQQREADSQRPCQEQAKDKNGKTVCIPAPPASWQVPQ
jgi:hypothetical protein